MLGRQRMSVVMVTVFASSLLLQVDSRHLSSSEEISDYKYDSNTKDIFHHAEKPSKLPSNNAEAIGDWFSASTQSKPDENTVVHTTYSRGGGRINLDMLQRILSPLFDSTTSGVFDQPRMPSLFPPISPPFSPQWRSPFAVHPFGMPPPFGAGHPFFPQPQPFPHFPPTPSFQRLFLPLGFPSWDHLLRPQFPFHQPEVADQPVPLTHDADHDSEIPDVISIPHPEDHHESPTAANVAERANHTTHGNASEPEDDPKETHSQVAPQSKIDYGTLQKWYLLNPADFLPQLHSFRENSYLSRAEKRNP